jgi:hypothetical protein
MFRSHLQGRKALKNKGESTVAEDVKMNSYLKAPPN